MADTPTNLLIPALTAAAGFFGGLATQWLTRWSADWFTRREIRAAIKAEIAPIVVTLNFYILKAIEAVPNEQEIAAQYFGPEMRFGAFDYYWSEKRDQLLKVPEWSRLQNWYSSLRTITQSDQPILFKAIMSFESLLIPPLVSCVDRTTKGVIRQTLERPDVERFKMDHLLSASGIQKA
jgi:hypothetical protein